MLLLLQKIVSEEMTPLSQVVEDNAVDEDAEYETRIARRGRTVLVSVGGSCSLSCSFDSDSSPSASSHLLCVLASTLFVRLLLSLFFRTVHSQERTTSSSLSLSVFLFLSLQDSLQSRQYLPTQRHEVQKKHRKEKVHNSILAWKEASEVESA